MLGLIAIVTYHLFYTNLLLNLRFSINLKSRTAGLICYKYVNYLFCHCCLEIPCRDKSFTCQTTFKWVFMTIFLVWTLYIIQLNLDFLYSETYEEVTADINRLNGLKTALIIYLLQNVIFLIWIIPLYALFACLTCC